MSSKSTIPPRQSILNSSKNKSYDLKRGYSNNRSVEKINKSINNKSVNKSLNRSLNQSSLQNEPEITETKVFKTYEHEIQSDPHEEIQLEKYIKDLFKLYDQNGDGSLTKEELVLFLNSIKKPFTDDELEELLQNMDRDKDGLIDVNELIFYLKTKSYYVPQTEAAEILDCFRVFDSNKDMTITKKELETIFAKFEVKGITKEDLDYFFKVADKDGNNFISYAEFVDFWKMK